VTRDNKYTLNNLKQPNYMLYYYVSIVNSILIQTATKLLLCYITGNIHSPSTKF